MRHSPVNPLRFPGARSPRSRAIWLCGVALAGVLGVLRPASAEQRPIVVELFTSQGCSSCPPADALLTELAARPDVLALAFHVTYWNNLGWKDPFSLPEATERQRQYQRQMRAGTIYTPQMVIEGQVDVVGSDRANVARGLAAARPQQSVPLQVSAAPGGVRIDVGTGAGEAQLLLVGYDPRHVTAVPRGENAGQRLVEGNIVCSVRKVGSWQGAALSLAAPLPAGERTAVILQAADGRILGAALLPGAVSG